MVASAQRLRIRLTSPRSTIAPDYPAGSRRVEERRASLLTHDRRLGQVVHLLHHEQALEARRDGGQARSQGLEDLPELRLDRRGEVREGSRGVAGNEPVLEAVPQALKPRGRGRRRLDQDHCSGGEPSALSIADGGGGKVQPRWDIGESLAIQAGADEVGEPITVGV